MCVSNFICISERDLYLPIPVVLPVLNPEWTEEEWGPTSEWLDILTESFEETQQATESSYTFGMCYNCGCEIDYCCC